MHDEKNFFSAKNAIKCFIIIIILNSMKNGIQMKIVIVVYSEFVFKMIIQLKQFRELCVCVRKRKQQQKKTKFRISIRYYNFGPVKAIIRVYNSGFRAQFNKYTCSVIISYICMQIWCGAINSNHKTYKLLYGYVSPSVRQQNITQEYATTDKIR